MARYEDPSKRLTILSPDEVEAIYDIPRFTDEERDNFFTLTPPEEAVLTDLGTVASKVIFILQLGYFKARHRLFTVKMADVKSDITFLQRQSTIC